MVKKKPKGPPEKEIIEKVFGQVLPYYNNKKIYNGDLQALMWYPEKKLYDLQN